jgi:chloride channel protein, CIC family
VATPEAPQLSGKTYLHLVALGAAIGLPAAVVAVGFLALVHELEHLLWVDLPDALGSSSPQWYLVLGLPVVGAALVLAARTLLPGDGGHSPLEGLSVEPTPLRVAPGVALAALGTLSFGAVLGPEAPLIALGSVVGLAVATVGRHGVPEQKVLATAGSFSAISALFGGPLAAGMLLLEAGVGLGSALIAVLLPGLVAAAIGYLVFVGVGDWAGVGSFDLAVPGLPVYDGTHVLDLVLAVVVGVATAIVVVLVKRIAGRTAAEGLKRYGSGSLLLAGGFAVGALALVADWLGANSQDVLFSGQSALPDLVAEDSARIVLVLLVAKGLAYAVSLGWGFRGGAVFPAMFLGVALAMLAVIAFDVSPTVAVAIGTAAGTAAVTRLLFSAALIASLLVGTAGVDAVPAAVLAAAAAWLTIAAIDRRVSQEPA